jgi:hypothetical protein
MAILDDLDFHEQDNEQLEKSIVKRFKILSILWMAASILGVLLLILFSMSILKSYSQPRESNIIFIILSGSMCVLLFIVGYKVWRKLRMTIFDTSFISSQLNLLTAFWVLLALLFGFMRF